MENNNEKLFETVHLFSSAVKAVAITSLMLMASMAQAGVDYTLTVTIDGNGCPTGVSDEDLDMNKAQGDTVRWQGPAGVGYEIFFDPFSGGPIKANPQGRTPVKHIANDTPTDVTFKYSVKGTSCTTKPAHDPRIRVF